MDGNDFADRSLPPTERRRREARQRGQVPRSAELTSAIVLLAATCLLWSILPASTRSLVGLLRRPFSSPADSLPGVETATKLIQIAAREAALIVGPIVLVLMTIAAVANLLQTGWLWVPTALIPRFRGGAFLVRDWAGKAAGTVVRLPVLAAVTTYFLLTHQSAFVSLGSADPIGMLVQPASLFGELLIHLCVSLLVMAIVDYAFQYWRNERQLMMTFEERRREQLDDSIDPRIKQRRADRSRKNQTASPVEIEEISGINR